MGVFSHSVLQRILACNAVSRREVSGFKSIALLQ